MGRNFVCRLRKSLSPKLSTNPAERDLCLDYTSVSGQPEFSWCGETSDNHLVQCRYFTQNARKFRTRILRVLRLRAPICGRALSCDRHPTFMPFFSLRCCLWVPSLSSLLPSIFSLMCLSTGTTHEAQSMSNSFLQPTFTSCFVQIFYSAPCCNSLSDLSSVHFLFT
jgi:hypothetical protein